MHPSRTITLLHISDTQFGRNHRFGRLGLPEPDAPFDTLFARLCDDLRLLKDKQGLVPDALIASGDLAEWGKKKEFDDVLALLTGLTEVLGLRRERVVIVPGNHDINRDSCAAYFMTCKANDEEPVAPYWPKWEHFHRMFRAFYGNATSIQFTPDEPWSWYEYDDLKLVIAGLNSTMAESHLEKDHHGYLGEKQLRWFADKLREYKDHGWFRLGVMHHNQQRGVPSDDESLHDADDLRRHLGRSLNLLLHGHTHEGKDQSLERNVPILSTGSAAVTAPARPEEIPNQYQVLRLHPERIERYTRCYDPRRKRWIGDDRGSEDGDRWVSEIEVTFDAVASLSPTAFTMPPVDERGSRIGQLLHQSRVPEFEPRRDDLLSRVEEVCRLRQPNAHVTRVEVEGIDYLRVTDTDGAHCLQYPVGVAEGGFTAEYLVRFLGEVHRPYRSADSGLISQIVYTGRDRPSQTLVDDAGRYGVRVLSLVEYQGLIDFRSYLERQTRRLENDPIYPPSLYVHQRMGCEAGSDRFDSEDALATVTEWLAQPEPRFVLLLGDFGTGKSFLLHMLALQLSRRDEGPTPVLIEMRGLQKARALDELIAQHLSAAGEERIDLKAFRYMLAQGRIALLFDGFDELALRVTYERAAEHFDTLIDAAAGRAKVVTTSRTQHFESEEQIKTALAARTDWLPGRRIGRLTGFRETQIQRFLVNRYGNEPEAEARLAFIRDIRDLFGLAANPRMLGFIADLPEEQLREARQGKGEITSAVLYRMLIERWLANENKRAEPRGAGPALSLHGLWEAVMQLALRLWQQAESSVRPGDLRDEAASLIPRLAVADMDAATAAHQLGSGTLLVRDEEGRFRFIHQSVMEWLVARRAAEMLATGGATALLGRRELSSLMADFFVALAVEQEVVLRDWVREVLGGGASEGEIVKMNALMINERLGDPVPLAANLAGQDLRGQDLSGRRDLAGADLRGADLSDARLAGADLTGTRLGDAKLVRADLSRAILRNVGLERVDGTGASLLGAYLWGATLTGSRWPLGKLVGARINPGALADCDLWGAALPEVTRVDFFGNAFADPCTSVCWHANHPVLASGHQSGYVRLWDLESGREIRRFEGHGNGIKSVAFSPNGKHLASGGGDETVRLWDIESGRELQRFEERGDPVRSVAFSPNGKRLASADGTTVRLWDVDSDRGFRKFAWHGDLVRSVAFSPDGTRLASGGDDNIMRLWDVESGREIRRFEGHGNGVQSVAFSPDGRCLASGSHKTVRLWDVESGRALGTLKGHGNWVLSVAFSPNGKHLASGGGDETVRLWDIESGRELRQMERHEGSVRSVAFSPDGGCLASGSDDKTVRLWDVESGRALRTLEGHGNWVVSVAFSPDGKTLASGSDDNTLRLWDIKSGHELLKLERHEGSVLSVAFSPDGKRLASGSWDKTVRLWDLRSGGVLRTLRGHGNGVLSVAFSPDGKTLASGGHDKTARLWEHLLSGRELRRLEGHGASVLSVAFSPDGQTLASGSGDNTVRLWDLASGRLLRKLEGHGAAVLSVAFSPDGQTLASGSGDNTVRLWDLASGRLLATLICTPEGWAAVTPDGRYKLGGDTAGAFWFAINLCRFEPGELDPYLPERLRRLAPDERIL
jgi:WD40 repeat protein/3',5'-cyclic AMP phosphodiesterase CpdA